jgi:hypothetical protein
MSDEKAPPPPPAPSPEAPAPGLPPATPRYDKETGYVGQPNYWDLEASRHSEPAGRIGPIPAPAPFCIQENREEPA